jgi:hypothetical protein
MERQQLKTIPENLVTPYHDTNEVISDFTIKGKQKKWLKNLKVNNKKWDFHKHDAHSMHDMDLGDTVYIVGASPSLENNIDDLKGRKTIFACGHILKYLLDNDIKPKFVFVVDCEEEEIEFINIGDKAKGITLIADICISPKVLEVWKGDVLFVKGIMHKKMDKKIKKITSFSSEVSSGGNVVGMMTVIAWSIGIKRIVFVGTDFSYIGNAFYVRDELVKQNLPATSIDFCYTYDIKGNKVNTLARLFMYKFFIDSCSIFAEDVEFINATEGGILGAYKEGNLKSIKQMSLKEVH